jgi:hypothetical protein
MTVATVSTHEDVTVVTDRLDKPMPAAGGFRVPAAVQGVMNEGIILLTHLTTLAVPLALT